MSFEQSGDALFCMTPDGGDMNIENGITEMTALYETATLFCLMGGNMLDNATTTTEKLQYMGNEDELPENKLRSRFQALLYGKPITTQLLVDLGEAAGLDILDGLGSFIDSIVSTVRVVDNKQLTVYNAIKLKTGEAITTVNRIPTQ